jgi:hypothetical protein
MLQDMDEKPVEEDSVMTTPAECQEDIDNDADDAEYSQAFNEDTIIQDNYKKCVTFLMFNFLQFAI